jgi:hypothetical protein
MHLGWVGDVDEEVDVRRDPGAKELTARRVDHLSKVLHDRPALLLVLVRRLREVGHELAVDHRVAQHLAAELAERGGVFPDGARGFC